MFGSNARLSFARALPVVLLAAGVTLVLAFARPSTADAAAGRVTICHIPPGNPDNAHTITVGRPSVRAHLAHGDFVGACNPGEEPLYDEEDPPETDEGEGDETDDDEHATNPDPEDEGEGDDDEQAAAPPSDDDEDAAAPFAANPGVGPCAHLFGEDSPSPGFYVLAAGNLDGDEDFSYFYRGAGITPDCRIVGPPAVLNENALE